MEGDTGVGEERGWRCGGRMRVEEVIGVVKWRQILEWVKRVNERVKEDIGVGEESG